MNIITLDIIIIIFFIAFYFKIRKTNLHFFNFIGFMTLIYFLLNIIEGYITIKQEYLIYLDYLKRLFIIIILLGSFQLRKNINFIGFYDSLTGLYNRRYFDNQIMKLNKSQLIPVTIIMIDLNHLKEVNDKLGHKAGDSYINCAVKQISKNLRKKSTIARLGGDEFGIILPNVTKDKANNIIKKINTHNCAIQNSKYFCPGKCISIGSSTKTNKEQDLYDVMKQADENMYQYKKITNKLYKS